MRGVLLRTAESTAAAPYAMALPALDRAWGDPATWHVLRRASLGVTPLYLLRALDLDLTAEGDVVAMADAPFVKLLLRTIWIACVVTLLCLVIGFPVALAIAAMPQGWARVALGFVMVPFWISIIVRTTAWFVLLQREGPVNAVLVALGIVEHPVQIMFTRFAVYLAMVHVLLPFAILPMLAVMRRIDGRFGRAAASLGAPAWRRFLRVTLPLAWPGVRAAGLIVFMLAAGFYITPSLMGGPRDQMLGAFIAEYATASLNWGMAAALGIMLMIGVAAVALAAAAVARIALGRAA
jgi:putative spermidine/putrescine transport system permease protein